MDYYDAMLARWEQEWVDGPQERKKRVKITWHLGEPECWEEKEEEEIDNANDE